MERYEAPFMHAQRVSIIEKESLTNHFVGKKHMCHFPLFPAIWVFPKIMVPPNHPFVHRDFHYFHHPFWGVFPPPMFGSTSI